MKHASSAQAGFLALGALLLLWVGSYTALRIHAGDFRISRAISIEKPKVYWLLPSQSFLWRTLGMIYEPLVPVEGRLRGLHLSIVYKGN